jgi:uncharacterized protein
MHDSIVEWIRADEAQALYDRDDSAHDFDHVRRVTHLAHAIARAEGANVAVVTAAALLHDAPAQEHEGDAAGARMDHHRAAAAFAQEYLTARGVPPADVANVVHCIEAHRFRDTSITPKTLEARCLYDADKLDSMGAIGVARAFAFAGAHANRLWYMPVAAIEAEEKSPHGADYTPVHEYVYKLDRLLATLQTATGRRLGKARHKRQAAFFAALDDEMAETTAETMVGGVEALPMFTQEDL